MGSWGPVSSSADVAVIGAGAVGASIAFELGRRGRQVVVLEQGPGWAAGCSWGNAGLICPSHAGPWATAQDVAQAARWMLRKDSPLGIRPSATLLPFLGRLLAARERTVLRATELSRRMCSDSLALHESMSQHGIDTGFRRTGLLDVYATARGLDRGAEGVKRHRQAGVRCTVMDRADVHALEPALEQEVSGGVFFPDEAHCDPVRFVEAVGSAAGLVGATLHAETKVLEMAKVDLGVELTTTTGVVRAGTVVVAAGAWSEPISRRLGRSIPLQSGKGYMVDLSDEEHRPLERPLMLQEARIAVTPLEGRLRLSGTMQFAGLDESIDLRRVTAIRRESMRMLPGWEGAAISRIWSGLRPCTPDGLPIVGWLRRDMPIVLATGHAMLGLTLAPITGKLVADLLEGSDREELAGLRPDRFDWLHRGAGVAR